MTSRLTSPQGPGGSAPSDASVVSKGPIEPPISATVIFINVLAIPFADQVQAKQRIAEVMRALPPREPIAIYVRNFTLRLMTDFTDDPKRIASALAESWGEQPQPPCIICNPPPALVDLEEIANQLASLPGRKNVLWLANFFPVGSEKNDPIALYQTTRTIRALNAANVAVFPIAADGVAGPTAYSAERSRAPDYRRGNPSTPRSSAGAMTWAESTGGSPAFNTDVGLAAQRALDYSEVTYNLGFYPETSDGQYHHLKVTVARKGVDVSSRQGYLATDTGTQTTTLTTGMDLAARGATPVGALNSDAIRAGMQLNWFYTGANRARVYLALDFTPRSMKFQDVAGRQHGRIDFIGTTSRSDGEAVGRFTESDNIDRETEAEAEAFTQVSHRFAHQFLLASGNYLFRMTIGVGPSSVRSIELPLTIEPWKSTSFAIGSIAFTNESSAGDKVQSPGGRPLIAAGREFVPCATNTFGPDDRIYFYTELYDAKLMSTTPPAVSIQYRVVDRATGEVKQDSAVAGLANYIRPGDPVIPFATRLTIAGLGHGSYRLEVMAGHSSDTETIARSVDFDVN